MERQIRKRLRWVRLYLETGDAGYVCRRCGISRPTLRKWTTRYQDDGPDGLKDRSRRPRRFPGIKVSTREESWILTLREARKLGARRNQNELRRLHELSLSLAAIHRVLRRHGVKPLVRRRRKMDISRPSRPVPGKRIQMDTCKIGPGRFQYTAVDACTRYRVLAPFSRPTAANTLLFLDQALEEIPFLIQRIQTDRGREFFAAKVQKRMMEFGTKFRPIRPGSPHLDGGDPQVSNEYRRDVIRPWSAASPPSCVRADP